MKYSNEDIQYLEELYIKYNRMVRNLIRCVLSRYGYPTEDADDLMHEVFIIAGEKIDQLRSHPNQGGWMAKTAHNLCKNHSRSKHFHKEQAVDSYELFSDENDVYAMSDVLMTLEGSLSEEEYELVEDYYIEKRPHAEICRKFGLSEAALRVRMHRLKKRIPKFFIFLVTFPFRLYM